MVITNKTKTILPLVILFFVLIHELGMHMVVEADHQYIDCDAKCDYRCSKTSRQKVCKRACNTCCRRCNCVPPGTYGNKEVCPCYASMKTHGGRLKCP